MNQPLKIPYMKKSTWFLLILIVSIVGCKSIKNEVQRRDFVGDIIADEALDDADFDLCGTEREVFQYFNNGTGLSFEGEKPALDKNLKERLNKMQFRDEGYIRVRFIVNCQGQSGRFRILTSDLNFQASKMQSETVDSILAACKEIKGWKVLMYDEVPRDYYQYLSFKIVNGKIQEILP